MNRTATSALLAAALGLVVVLGACKKDDKKTDRADEDGDQASASANTDEPEADEPEADEPEAEPVDRPTPLPIGSDAPDFTAKAHDGTDVTLSDFRGRTVVLYFYPKDDTPGCTIEAKGFRDHIDDFVAEEAAVLGVSLDDVDSHTAFVDKYELPFKLIADTEGTIAAKYGVDTSAGYAARVTFIIGPQGTIAHTFPEVDPNGHSEEVLALVKEIKETAEN